MGLWSSGMTRHSHCRDASPILARSTLIIKIKFMNLIIKWLIMVLAIVISSYLIPGVAVAGFWSALWLALFLGIINVSQADFNFNNFTD